MRYLGVRRRDIPTPAQLIVVLAIFVAVVGGSMLIRGPGADPATGAPAAVTQPDAGADPCAGPSSSRPAPSSSAPSSSAPSSSAPSSPASSSSAVACHDHGGGPTAADFISIDAVKAVAAAPRPGPGASTGTFVSDCGRNENNHFNSDNFLTSPGVSNGAHHTHDYVGNLSTDAYSTDDSLAAAGTTCKLGDQSTYFWPVLRRTDAVGSDANAPGGGREGNLGEILLPTSVRLEFRGNPNGPVVAMPRFLRLITGDATAGTLGPARARAQWTCVGSTDRITTKYPLCPNGSGVQRVLVFPSCWDGKNTDSANHRTHVLFQVAGGKCPAGTQAIPELRVTLTYTVPPGPAFALDSFPEQKRNPLTDHGVFGNVMPESLMKIAVNCINGGQNC